MRLRLINRYLLLFACAWLLISASAEDVEFDDEEGRDLMRGRLWHPDTTGTFSECNDKRQRQYRKWYANFEEVFGENQAKDVQQFDQSPSMDFSPVDPDQEIDPNEEGQNHEGEHVYPNNFDDYDYYDHHEDDRSPDRDGDDTKIKQKGSLAIVFDTTKSMAKELIEVKKGAKAIVNTLANLPDSPIVDYIFSPFNDPRVGPLTKTTSPKVLEKKMNDIVVRGGGDCPELSLTGLKNALEASLMNSKFYVFTDAPAKDTVLYKEVVTLVQRKRAEVNFIITKGCISNHLDQLWVYDYIAQASSGHLYKVRMEDLKDIMNFVKMALKLDVVSLLSVNDAPDDYHNLRTYLFDADPSMTEFTISVSGLNAKVSVTDPRGHKPKEGSQVLGLAHLQVLKVEYPKPGTWKVKVECKYPFMIRITGISPVNFEHGFSRMETDNMKNTNYRPLKDAKSHILIQTTDKKQNFRFTSVNVLNMKGQVLSSLALQAVQDKPNLYKASGFVPPNKFFYLKINGMDLNNNKISRITATAVSPQKAGPPVVTMRKKALKKINRPGTLNCDIESQLPVKIGWKKGGELVDGEQECSESCGAILHFKIFTKRSEGNYTCFAENHIGKDSKTVELQVGDPPTVRVTSPIRVNLGHKARLVCHVESPIPYKTTWGRTLSESSLDIVPLEDESHSGDSLEVTAKTSKDFGWYACIVRSKEGKTIAKIHLMNNNERSESN